MLFRVACILFFCTFNIFLEGKGGGSSSDRENK